MEQPPIPKRIYFLWLQGLAAAPELIRICHRKWAALNPDYEVVLLDGHDVERLLAETALPFRSIPVQALSDIVRARLLLDHGGVWVDATVMPVAPLTPWLDEMAGTQGFFALERPGPDRPISSWFLAASQNNPMMRWWWPEIERFWSRPRRLVAYPGGVPPDPVAEVSPEAGGQGDTYPYFWFHYLFRYLVETRPEATEFWSRCVHRSALPACQLQFLFDENSTPTLFEIIEKVSGAPIHKLNWRAPYPLDLFAAIGDQVQVFLKPEVLN